MIIDFIKDIFDGDDDKKAEEEKHKPVAEEEMKIEKTAPTIPFPSENIDAGVSYCFEHTLLFLDLSPEFEDIALKQLHEHEESLDLSPETVLPLIINEVKEEDYTEEFIAALEGDDRGQKLGWNRIGASLMALDREQPGNENLPESADSLLKRLISVLKVQDYEGLFSDETYGPLFEGKHPDQKLVKKHWINCLALTFKSKKKLAIGHPGHDEGFINRYLLDFIKPLQPHFSGLSYIDPDNNIFLLSGSGLEGYCIDGFKSWEENGEEKYADETWAYLE